MHRVGFGCRRALVLNRVVTLATGEAIAVRAAAARHEIITRVGIEDVIRLKSVDIVVASGIGIRDGPCAHGVAIPCRAIGKLDGVNAARIGRHFQCAHQHHTITLTGKADDKIIAVGSCAQCKHDISDIVIGQHKLVGASGTV